MFRDATFVYKDAWKTRNQRILHAGQELDNVVDKFEGEGGPKQRNSR